MKRTAHVVNRSPEQRETLLRPKVVLFSSDEKIADLVRTAIPERWRIEHQPTPEDGLKILTQPNVRLVIFDDEGIEEGDRDWILGLARKWAPSAPLMYVAANHDGATEQRARTGGAQYYASKPIDEERVMSVLQSFQRASK